MLDIKASLWQSEMTDGRVYFVGRYPEKQHTAAVVRVVGDETKHERLGIYASLDEAIAACQAHSDSVSAESAEVA